MVAIDMARLVTMQINGLDNDCLSLVFNQFTLQQLIALRIICKRWHSVIELICHKKSSLQLFASIEDGGYYWQFAKRYNDQRFSVKKVGQGGNQLLLSGQRTDLSHSNLLPNLFPNVTKLVYRCKLDLVPLLESWTNLEYLCVYMLNEEQEEEKIWTNINSMQTLKRLHLFVYGRAIVEEMPILARLERFSLSYYFGNIVSVLAKLGPVIRRLYLDYIPCDLNQLRQLVQIQPEIALNLTHLTVVNIRSSQSSVQDRKKFLQLICNNFLSLKHLDVTFTNQMPLIELVSYLSGLKHLVELKLQISCILPETNCLPVHAVLPLESIKSLYLIFCEPYDGAHLANFDKIPVIFPMVENLIIHSCNADLLPSLKRYLCLFRYLRKTNLNK